MYTSWNQFFSEYVYTLSQQDVYLREVKETLFFHFAFINNHDIFFRNIRLEMPSRIR